MTTITIGVQDGTTLPAYLARPAADRAPTGVIVAHELFGVNPGITGKLLYLVGDHDALIDAGQREQIRAALVSAGVEHEIVSYPGVGHAFFWPGTPPFDATARHDAWARILALLGPL